MEEKKTNRAQLCNRVEVLANAKVVIISQYINASNQHLIYPKLAQCYVSVTTPKKKKYQRDIGKEISFMLKLCFKSMCKNFWMVKTKIITTSKVKQYVRKKYL